MKRETGPSKISVDAARTESFAAGLYSSIAFDMLPPPADWQRMTIPGASGLARVESFDPQTNEAVTSEYLEHVRALLEKIPKSAWDLESKVPAEAGRDDSYRRKKIIDELVDFYVYPGLHHVIHHEDKDIVPGNPFGLIMPKGLEDIESFLREQNNRYGYKSRSLRESERATARFDGYGLNSSKHENEFIRVKRAWNEYHVRILEALNIADVKERAYAINELGKSVFGEPVGFTHQARLNAIAPFDNHEQWVVFQVMNILHSPEPGITPIARYRAVQLLANMDVNKLKLAFFGEKGISGFSNEGRKDPSFAYGMQFKKQLTRLPRSMWRTHEERTSDIHTNWESNPVIISLVGQDLVGAARRENIDYRAVFNTLVEKYPKEAVHVTLLMMFGSYYFDKHAAFDGLLALTQLDPIARQAVFGPRASYNYLASMPTGEGARIAEGLGIVLAGDDDLAVDLSGLSTAEQWQVNRRLIHRIRILERQLAESTRKEAEVRFSTMKQNELDAVDPDGYWRILGVHPDTDPADIEDILKRAYRVLVMKYHPDTRDKSINEATAEEKIRELNEAFEVLSDPARRARYGRQ